MAKVLHKSNLNIKGFDVELVKINHNVDTIGDYYCAYVNLTGSKILCDRFLNHPTYRKDDTVGVDTAHYRNTKMSIDEKMRDALQQIEEVIHKYQFATDDDYQEELF